jgi:hypothetical protein
VRHSLECLIPVGPETDEPGTLPIELVGDVIVAMDPEFWPCVLPDAKQLSTVNVGLVQRICGPAIGRTVLGVRAYAWNVYPLGTVVSKDHIDRNPVVSRGVVNLFIGEVLLVPPVDPGLAPPLVDGVRSTDRHETFRPPSPAGTSREMDSQRTLDRIIELNPTAVVLVVTVEPVDTDTVVPSALLDPIEEEVGMVARGPESEVANLNDGVGSRSLGHLAAHLGPRVVTMPVATHQDLAWIAFEGCRFCRGCRTPIVGLVGGHPKTVR